LSERPPSEERNYSPQHEFSLDLSRHFPTQPSHSQRPAAGLARFRRLSISNQQHVERFLMPGITEEKPGIGGQGEGRLTQAEMGQLHQ
jgi:hypothetical protein